MPVDIKMIPAIPHYAGSAGQHRQARAGARDDEFAGTVHVILSIQDDGRGFDTSTVKAYAGHGLQNMQERARALGAQLRIDSAVGQGTLIVVKLPVTK
jgi:nitrate/nitrite-specific signal transduction histidine kinase